MTATTSARGSYIPWLFVAGFVLVVAVNATMIWFAVGSFSGLYTPDPRGRGLHYNDVIAAEKSRNALGWAVDASWRAESGRIEVTVRDHDGRPLSGGKVTVEFVRPVEKREPIGVAMTPVEAGRYAGYATLPARGNWDVDIVVEREGGHFAQTRRMFLK